jgi:hypothetical protein
MGQPLRAAGALVALGAAVLLDPRAGGAQGCARPNVPAMIVHAVDPDVPPMAQQQAISGTVQIIVSLDTSSRVTGTRVLFSPSAILNSAALAAARQSTYQTEIRNCVPIAADFVFSAKFVGEPFVSADGRPNAVITAQGAALRPPDIAYLTALITTSGDVAATSAAKNDTIYGAVRARLKPLGIDETALRTTYFNVTLLPSRTPALDAAGRYVTNRQIVLTLSDVDKAGAALDALLAAGVTNVGQVRFELRDRHDAYAEALTAALKDAGDQAQTIARSSRMRLAGIRQIVVGQNLLGPPTPPPGPPLFANAPAGTVATNVHPVPVEVRANVTVTYVFKP